MNSGRGIWSTLIHREIAEVNGGPTRITDQKFLNSDDLLIDQCALVIERCVRNRNYSPTLGRWINQDPAGYINGANTYQFVEGNPGGNVDPWGEATWPRAGMTMLVAYPNDPQANAVYIDSAGNQYWGNNQSVFGPLLFYNPPPWNCGPAQPPWMQAINHVLGTIVPAEDAGPEIANVAGDLALQGTKDAMPSVEPKPDTNGPARQAYPDEGHHFLPKQFSEDFKKVRLNPEDFVEPLPKDIRRLKPGGIHTGPYEDSWNGQWGQFFENNPSYTKADVLEQLAKMKEQFGVK